MTRKSVKRPERKPIRTYKKMIKYTCPVRGEVEEEVEVKVYGAVPMEESSRFEDPELRELLRQEGVVEDEED